jgi:AraC family transcriptional regulator, activator of mtrCDE
MHSLTSPQSSGCTARRCRTGRWRSWRLQLAAHRLKTTAMPMKGIADLAGYKSEAAFSRTIKRHFGLPPADWRRPGITPVA